MHSRDTTERYPVLADEPLEVRHPRRKIRLIAASFAVAILMTGGSRTPARRTRSTAPSRACASSATSSPPNWPNGAGSATPSRRR